MMSKVKVEIPKIFAPIWGKARYKVFFGGRGSSKSESVARYLLVMGMKEKQNILCCREYMVSIKESVYSLLSGLTVELGLGGFYDVLQSEIRGKNGTRFFFAGLKNNVANIKSMYEIKRCWIEEAQTLSENSINVLLPTIRAEESEILFTMNPILPTDPAYVRFILNPPKDSVVVKVNYDLNPFFPNVLEQERLDLLERDPIAYRNVWLGEPRSAVEGAIYAQEIQKARDEGRIGVVKYDASKPCSTYWDIGQANCMSIIIEQKVGLNSHLVDFIQDNNQKVPYYLDLLQKRGYVYSRHVLPHDARQDRANAEFTTEVMVRKAFPNSKVEVNENFPGAVLVGIEAVKAMFPFWYIDEEKCADFLFSMAHYHWKVDSETGRSYGKEPDHAYSDAPDAARTMAMSYKKVKSPIEMEMAEIAKRQKKTKVGSNGKWWM